MCTRKIYYKKKKKKKKREIFPKDEVGFKAYHLIESINKYSVIQFPIMTIQISDDSHIKNVLRTSNYEHADQYNIKLATKTYPLKSNKNKEHPMNPNPPKKKKKNKQTPLNQKGKQKK